MSAVLLVEDVRIAQMAATKVLESLSFTVDVATTGIEALAYAKEKPYSVIFMDIGLPDNVDGFSVAEEIRNTKNLNQDTLVIALTSHDENKYVEKMAQSGMNGFLTKPLTVEKVKAVIPVYLVEIGE